ncbi:MAG: NADH-quinone oxidoreductase subunit M [Methanohalobium sp.]|uniref:NADH-quinone oxidoreductase subunit M n=1 Tax=Methanohalobium sp. TaxID=2837493 RepID=UPI00397DE656
MNIAGMTDHLPILMVAVPILLSALMMFLRSVPTVQKIINLAVSFGLFVFSVLLIINVWNNGIIVYDIGEWGKYGIVLVADLLSAGMVLLSSGISFLALLYSMDYMEDKSLSSTYHSLFNLLIAGLNGTFLTGDLFNLFVFFEILLLSSCGLVVAYGKGGFTKSDHKMEATFKYLVLNMVSSFIMLIAIASLYATVGTLNMADMAAKINFMNEAGNLPWHVFPAALLFIVVFGNKAAIFPLHYWLPDVHPSAPSPISAMLSGVLIKVGAYGVIRIFFLIFNGTLYIFQPIIIFLALATIIIGSISAVGQDDIKRLLAYSSVSQIGYVFLGIGMGTVTTIAASLVYLANHAVAKSMLFMTSGSIIHEAGTRDMRKMGGMVNNAPFLSGMFLIGAMSIAGIPPMGGFIAKFVLFDSGITGGYYIPIIIALIFAIFTVFYMIKAWQRMFWGEVRNEKYDEYHSHGISWEMSVPIVILSLVVIVFGLYAEPLLSFAQSTASQVLDPQDYINAVLTRDVR